MLFLPGIMLAAVWRIPTGIYLVGAFVYMVVFVLSMLFDDRCRKRRNERAWRASPYWRVPRTPEERRLNAELQGFTRQPNGGGRHPQPGPAGGSAAVGHQP